MYVFCIYVFMFKKSNKKFHIQWGSSNGYVLLKDYLDSHLDSYSRSILGISVFFHYLFPDAQVKEGLYSLGQC